MIRRPAPNQIAFRLPLADLLPGEIIVDSFAGGGGASLGIEKALGRSPDIAINHDAAAIRMHEVNHPSTKHFQESVWAVKPREVTGGAPVGLLWASPDCRHFSRAKGGKPVSPRVRGLAWVVVAWARQVQPRVICLENVPEFLSWGPLGADSMPIKARAGETYARWAGQLERLGYRLEKRILNAADFGAPTSRKRIFIVARRDGLPIRWPEPSHGPGRAKPYRTAAECIDWSIPCPSIFDRSKPLAEATLARIARGIKRYVLDDPKPFIVQVNHGRDEFRGQKMDQPAATITAQDHHSPVAVHLTKMYGTCAAGAPADQPAPTATSGGLHTGIVAAHLTHYHKAKKDEARASSPRDPQPTQTVENRFGLVYAFLAKYYGTAVGQVLGDPLHAITGKDRFGVVTVTIDGQEYAIADIGMRMLQPHELARAQGFPEDYHLVGTKSEQVAKIGNSVCPPVAEALVRANLVQEQAERYEAIA